MDGTFGDALATIVNGPGQKLDVSASNACFSNEELMDVEELDEDASHKFKADDASFT